MNIIFSKIQLAVIQNPEDEDKYGRLFDVERERKYNSHLKAIWTTTI